MIAVAQPVAMLLLALLLTVAPLGALALAARS